MSEHLRLGTSPSPTSAPLPSSPLDSGFRRSDDPGGYFHENYNVLATPITLERRHRPAFCGLSYSLIYCPPTNETRRRRTPGRPTQRLHLTNRRPPLAGDKPLASLSLRPPYIIPSRHRNAPTTNTGRPTQRLHLTNRRPPLAGDKPPPYIGPPYPPPLWTPAFAGVTTRKAVSMRITTFWRRQSHSNAAIDRHSADSPIPQSTAPASL